ncbi:hypothetical protein IMG5_202100 [Ichthyophthirius multifiliis]|uniref:GPR180/TMEM145 transmembrane domain-containing protein n=1 Tax=Ichthyophthirius multifiliis TaxID=5932 RepID=G0R627_ICHMU|nr:hypothetical protein IMG5_202100 [Ichthyophthirius multifiliis]EGR27093.1 hypothetical protein IMG5_202100 [Ichthyophthirius multifiliis]|eukprot:XP_004023977.1 hypothetical protein IMG5_202100 [Ichthyophthirius multifiliis]
MAIIFILISWGWTINYMELESLDIYVPLAFLIGIIHMIIVGLSRINDDSSHKFHHFDGWVGWVIVLLRFGLFFISFMVLKILIHQLECKRNLLLNNLDFSEVFIF